MNWITVGKTALKVAIWAIGHEDVLKHTITDAKAKNVGGLAHDAADIASSLKP